MSDDGFEVFPTRKIKKRQRICVTGFSSSVCAEQELVQLFQEAGISISPDDVQLEGTNKLSYVVSCEDAGRAVSLLNGKAHNGINLVVKRDSKPRLGQKGKSTFSANSWTKPPNTIHQIPKQSTERPEIAHPVECDVGNLTLEKVEQDCHSQNLVVASAATMALLASMDAFGDDLPGVMEHTAVDTELNEPSLDEFKANCKMSLSQLLADYGDQDLDFKNKKIEEQLEDTCDVGQPAQETKNEMHYTSRLGQHGKAPIHVELTSFGYSHRAPTIKSWSHAHPLQPVDCRHLHQTPYWLVRPDGRNPSVKRAILNDETRQLCKTLANQVVDALQEAIQAGYGHAMPLRMNIYVGSETGRHRSVVVCEATGILLRQHLRSNLGDRVSIPVSVGMLHQDIDRKQKDTKLRAENDPHETI